MAKKEQQTSPPSVPSGNGQPVKAGVMPLFSTWIYLCEDGPRLCQDPTPVGADETVAECSPQARPDSVRSGRHSSCTTRT